MVALATLEPAADPKSPLLLYDGTCGLCHKSVKWLLHHERDHALRFAPLQGPTGDAMRAKYPNIPTSIDSVVLIANDRAYLRSKAFMHVAQHLRAPWRWAYAFRWMPGFVMDLGYRLVASLRYRIWGRADLCDLPSPENRKRFIA